MKFLKTYEQHTIDYNVITDKTNENLETVAINKDEIQSQRDEISAKIADIENKLSLKFESDNKTDASDNIVDYNTDNEVVVGLDELELQLEGYKKELSDLDSLIKK